MSTGPDGAHRGDTAPVTTNPAVQDPGRHQPPVQSPPPIRATPPEPIQHSPASEQRTEVIHTKPEHTTQPDRRDLRAQQKERFGGIKWGAAFFGWLAAIGTFVLLTALIAAVGGAIGLSTPGAADQAGQAAQNPGPAQTAGIVSAIVAAAILLIAYYCGGYVAGRMARFNGMKQGIAVWVWTIVITIVAAILVAVTGARFNVLGAIGGLPQLPVDGDAISVAAIITVLVALAVSLLGAILGGLAGMRFHRKIDHADLDNAVHNR